MRSWKTFWKIATCVFCGPYLSAGQIDRSGWNCKADSWELQTHDCELAIDGNVKTFWHTKTDPYSEPLPHNFQIDLGQVYQTKSFTYLPRQDSNNPNRNKNGNIGSWQISLSVDRKNWRRLNGTWSDDQQLKTVDFMFASKPYPARYFKLTAFTEAGSRGPWSSAAEFNIFSTSSRASDDSYNGPSKTSTHSAITDQYKESSAPPASFMTSTRLVSPTPTAGSASDTSTQQSNKSDSGNTDQGGGLNNIQTIFTVIGSIAGVIAVGVSIKLYCSHPPA
ncbi:MAG: hypothetical protein Q9181_005220 [Wetmoreana brouardii]